MIQFKKTDIALITNETVEKTFNNEDAYLYAIIRLKKDDEHNKQKTYQIRTDLANYKEVTYLEIDENNETAVDENNNPLTVTKNHLTWLETKQDWYDMTVTYSEIDAFAQSIESTIPNDLSKTEREILQLKTIFLMQRQQLEPWGIDANQWRKVTPEDYIK